MPERSPAELRHDALMPFLDQLGAGGEIGGPEVAATIAVGGYELELGDWERSVLSKAEPGANGGSAVRTRLLAEGLAFQAKCHRLEERFEKGPMPAPHELDRFLDGLVTDAAVGLALQKELQREIDRMVCSGRLSHAKSLTGFRNKIVHFSSGLKIRIGKDAFGRAEERAECLVTPPEKTEVLRPALLEEQAEAPTPYKARTEYAPARPVKSVSPHRTKRLFYVLCVVTAIYGAVIIPIFRTHEPPALTLTELGGIRAVQSVEARPPSLYVTMDAHDWNAMSSAERREVLQQMADIADAVDYFGIHVRTSDGAPVGEWLKKTGVRLYATTPSAT